MYTNEQLAKRFGCTVEALRNCASVNAAEARKFEAIARGTGEKVRGYTADEWAKTVRQCWIDARYRSERVHHESTQPRAWPLNTDCAICGRSYSKEQRASIGCDPNACSDWCLRDLPPSVRTPWTVSLGGWVSFGR